MVIVKMMRIVVTKAARRRTSQLQLAEVVVPGMQKKKKSIDQTILTKIIVSTLNVSKIYYHIYHILLNIIFYRQGYKLKARDHQSKYMD